jgi:hypothetical protein
MYLFLNLIHAVDRFQISVASNKLVLFFLSSLRVSTIFVTVDILLSTTYKKSNANAMFGEDEVEQYKKGLIRKGKKERQLLEP